MKILSKIKVKTEEEFISFIKRVDYDFYVELKEYLLKSVNNYKVINKHLIIEELTNIINKQKINQNIIQSNITIIIDSTYTNLDKENIESIFKEIYFNKIKFIKLQEILKQSKKELIIDLSQNNIKYYYLNEVIEQKIYFLEYINNLKYILNNILSIHNIESIDSYLYLNLLNLHLDVLELSNR